MKKKAQKQYQRYIPMLILNEIEICNYPRKDDLYCILDMIYRKTINYKTELQKIYGFVEIPNSVFAKLIADGSALAAGLKFLIEEGYIVVNEHYFPGQFSKSYKIDSAYLSKKMVVTITNKNINKRIELIEKDNKKFIEKQLEFSQTNYFNTFKIDFKGAYDFIFDEAVSSLKLLMLNLRIKAVDADIKDVINCKHLFKTTRANIITRGGKKEMDNILYKFTNQHFKILAINGGYLYFKRNNTNGRLDSNLTNLPTTLRQFLISDEKLFNIDIKNSQPYFLYSLLKNEAGVDKIELERYGQLVINGDFYEFLMEEFNKSTGKYRTRNQMKKMIFKIFYSKAGSFDGLKKFFGSLFPSIMNHINETNKTNNSVLPIQLQTIESTSIISVVLPELGKMGIKPFTIHDSFVCRESEAATIIEVFNKRLIEMYGIAPALHVNSLLDESNGADEEDIQDVSDEEWAEFITDWNENNK